MRFAALVCVLTLAVMHTPARAQEGPQKAPAEPPLGAIVAHFFPDYALVALGDLSPEIGALTADDPVYDHPSRSPTMIRADFDGNGHHDFAVLIKKQTGGGSDEIFTILLGYGQGRYAKTMESFFGRLSGNIYLGFVPAGATINRAAASPAVEPVPLQLEVSAVTLNVLNETRDAFFWDTEYRMFSREPIAR